MRTVLFLNDPVVADVIPVEMAGKQRRDPNLFLLQQIEDALPVRIFKPGIDHDRF
jgi:hypothetical protein